MGSAMVSGTAVGAAVVADVAAVVGGGGTAALS